MIALVLYKLMNCTIRNKSSVILSVYLSQGDWWIISFQGCCSFFIFWS